VTGEAKQECDLHVGGLAVRRGIHGGRVLMRVDEEQAGGALLVTQRWEGAQ